MKRAVCTFMLIMILLTADPGAGTRPAAAFTPVPVLRVDTVPRRLRRRNHYAGTVL